SVRESAEAERGGDGVVVETPPAVPAATADPGVDGRRDLVVKVKAEGNEEREPGEGEDGYVPHRLLRVTQARGLLDDHALSGLPIVGVLLAWQPAQIDLKVLTRKGRTKSGEAPVGQNRCTDRHAGYLYRCSANTAAHPHDHR